VSGAPHPARVEPPGGLEGSAARTRPATPGGDRFLIVNADDLGMSADVNRGILQAHQHGIVTSASLMVRRPAAREAAELCREWELDVGLHLDLGEWILRDGEWILADEVVPPGDPSAVEAEVERQLQLFRVLVGAHPTHVDSHQHVHREKPLRSIATRLAERLGVPLRSCTEGVSYCGNFYGQGVECEPFPEGIGVENLLAILRGLPPGVTELGCHPGDVSDAAPAAGYHAERVRELEALCDPLVRACLRSLKIRLLSFGQLRAMRARGPIPRG
jgi:predicted glycoside hydrolase/deacetylase ChbG (UPF0249 family)